MQEVISKVKAALGENAYIIEKRILKNKNFFKLGGKEEIIEIVASAAPSVVNDVTPRYNPANHPYWKRATARIRRLSPNARRLRSNHTASGTTSE